MASIYSDISLLHPKFAGVVKRLHEFLIDSHETKRTKTRFEIFETFRDPVRQNRLFAQKTTKALAWQSAHNIGLACDFVPYITGDEAIALSEATGERHFPGWSWHSSHDWDYLTNAAKRFSLTTIEWDRPHVQHPQASKILLMMKNI